MRVTAKGTGSGHAQSDGNRAGSVTCHEGVGDALTGLGETGHTAELTQTIELRLTTGQDLMDIGLMSYIEDQTVRSGIIYRFQCHGKLHGAKIGGKMTSGPGDPIDQELSDLLTKLDPFLIVQTQKVLVALDIL
jgi:hypothetical protein